MIFLLYNVLGILETFYFLEIFHFRNQRSHQRSQQPSILSKLTKYKHYSADERDEI